MAIDAHMLPSDPRFDASVEVLAREKFIQITRNLRQRERMVFAAHATPQITQQAVMHLREAVIVGEGEALQPLRLKQLPEYVFEHIHAARKAVEDLFRRSVGALRCRRLRTSTLSSVLPLSRGGR